MTKKEKELRQKVIQAAIDLEIKGLNKEMAYKVLKLASYKLPIKTKIVEKV